MTTEQTIIWAKADDGTERAVVMQPSYHRCAPDPKQDYGIHGGHILFVLRENGNAITFDLSPDWGMSPEAFHAANPGCTHHRHQGDWPHHGAHAGRVSLHISHAIDTALSHDTEGCDWTGATECWYDASFSLGDEFFDELRHNGGDAMWARLREFLANYVRDTSA